MRLPIFDSKPIGKVKDLLRFGTAGFAILLMLASCQTPAEKHDEPAVYYDIKGFIQSQIQLLNQQKPVVEKTMVVGNGQEKRSTSEVNWEKELELFVQADINKPAYRQSYAIARPDSLTYEYTIQTQEDLPVRYLKVVLDQADGQPALIEARILAENKLFESEKNLLMHCAKNSGQWRVATYQIKGFQELVISDRKLFDVQAEVH
ncbi:hypothetical protein [Salmonirosea aquatica]|uniref:Lipoprotein n=1 Tax=Salmonirosea aquatica TaxID=2654236 RepID=A0A7C9BIE6_9BACT|nr:hypothetical protein [Cytophagaceae bacterium SJW1-29]